MKKVNVIFLTLALAIVTLVSCDKDDDEPTNYFKVDGTTYELSGAHLLEWEEEVGEGAYEVDLTFYTGSINNIGISSGGAVSTGVGDMLVFIMNSSTMYGLPTGDYPYSATEGIVNTFDASVCFLNYNSATEESDSRIEINQGTVSVTKNGNEYEITVDCTATTGEKITAHYKGTL